MISIESFLRTSQSSSIPIHQPRMTASSWFSIAVIASVLWFYLLLSFFDLSNHLGFVCSVLILMIVFGIVMSLTSSEEKDMTRERDLYVLSKVRK